MAAHDAALFDPATIAAILIGSARAFGLIAIFPLFSLFGIDGLFRAALAIGVSAPFIAGTAHSLGHSDPSLMLVVGLMLKEVLVGVGLGVALGVPLWAFQTAGDLIDVYRGANQSNIFDQINALESTPLGSILLTCAMMLVVGSGGLLQVFRLFAQSFAYIEPTEFTPRLASVDIAPFLGFLGLLIKTGALFALPVVLVLGTAELGLAFIGKSSRQIQLNDTIQTAKNAATVFGLILYGTFILEYVQHTWDLQLKLLRLMVLGPNGG